MAGEEALQECDLVMKGGITSGVVYPFVLDELSRDYRLRQIGGTSAGAIAAVFAAAAEYERQASGGRSREGFSRICALADELATSMRSLFQPSRELRGPFRILIAAVSADRSVVAALLRTFHVPTLVVLCGLCAGALAFRGDPGLGLFVVLSGLVIGAILAALMVGRWLVHFLPAADFGLCPGRTQPGSGHAGFTDWIRAKVDEIAGKTGGPLTIEDLERHDIALAAMTTDLSSGRPYQLPLRSRIHYFSRLEFLRLFDEEFVDYLCEAGGAFEDDRTSLPIPDPYRLPSGGAFPVALLARMSLSFPGLIAAVPLYRYDDQLPPGHPERMRRCLFSDGGISINFPIHFFDSLLPVRPPFGVTLERWDRERHGEDRVVMVDRAGQSTGLPVREIRTLTEFGSSILNTAKDWQDTLQSLLPGYADRIVTIRLDPVSEGGMHLGMPRETILRLAALGREAGRKVVERFSYARGANGFDQHRYYRAVSLLPKLEGSLEGLASALDSRPVGAPAAPTTTEVMTGFDSRIHKMSNSWRIDPFTAFAVALAGIARGGSADLGGSRRRRIQEGGGLPHFDAEVRLSATADRIPRSAASGHGGSKSDV